MKFLAYDRISGSVVLNEDAILLVKEVSVLLDVERNKSKVDKTGLKKERAFKELSYIFLFFD